MQLYDDILIKAISHNAGTVIRHKPTPSGVITTLLQHAKKEGRTDERSGKGKKIYMNGLS